MLQKSKTFHDFNQLLLKGQLQLLTFGQYCAKINTTKYKRKLVIKYMMSKL